jgi:hypothetical protein
MAKYGVWGLGLARSVEDLDPGAFLAQIHGMSTIPPVFPLMEWPAFLLFGDHYAVPRALVGALFAGVLAAALWAGRELDDTWGPLAGGIAAALLATGPFHLLLGTLVLLETPGMLLTLLALALSLRAGRDDRIGTLRAACLAATALFFLKYNYGLLWLAPMVTAEAWRRSGSLRCLVNATAERLRSVDLRRPWPAFVAVVLVAALALLLTGPWHLEAGGRTLLRASSTGTLLYGLWILFLVRCAVRPRSSTRRLRTWLGGLHPRSRTMVLWIGLPIALWLLAPSHAKDLASFLENRSSGMTLDLGPLAYYPRLLVGSYAFTPVVGFLALVLAFLGILRLPRESARRRVLPLAALLGLVALVAHPYKLPRFAAILAPLLWLTAGWTVAVVLRALFGERPALARALAAAAMAAALLVPVPRSWLEGQLELRTVPVTTRPVVDTIAAEAAAARGSVLLGFWNELSPGLVEWHCRQAEPDLETRRIPRWLSGRERRGDLLGRLAGDPTLGTVMVLGALPGSSLDASGFAAETDWLEPVRREIATDSRFSAVETRTFPASGYRLTFYRVLHGF